MSNHLLKLLKNEPLYLRTYLNNFNSSIMYKSYHLSNSVLHLSAIYYPKSIIELLNSPIIISQIDYNLFYTRRNFFGQTWLHILCQYNIEYYDSIKELIEIELIHVKDIVGNTCLHVISRFNPEYLEKFLTNKNINNYLLSSKDILGNTFLHILNYHHPNHYKKIEKLFNNNIIKIKNIFGSECYNYYQESNL